MVIEKQIEMVTKYCKENNCVHLIMDNSDDLKEKKKIERICGEGKETNVIYFALPDGNPYSGKRPSSSHGAAINWCWYNVVQKVANIKRVLLLDHDIFPIKEFDIKETLKNQIAYGLKINIGHAWYLWPGLCAFDIEKLHGKKMNFMPGKYGDTGAMNYPIIYASCCVDEMMLAHDRLVWISGETGDEKRSAQRDSVQVIDESWIHMINASNWAGLDNVEEKFKQVIEMLENL